MNLISPETQCHWFKDRHFKDGAWALIPHGWRIDHPTAIEKLLSIEGEPTIAQMVDALYPTCITDIECSECNRICREVVELMNGNADHADIYERVQVCRECVEKAMALFA